MTDHDTELVAMIDNELDGDAKARLPARLVQDEAMRERYDALREAGRSIAIAWMLCSKRRRFLKFAPVSRRRTPGVRRQGGYLGSVFASLQQG
jgi:hypothetical protein